MIPSENIFTIVVTIIYLLTYYENWLLIFKNKEIRMIIAIFESAITGFAWCFTIFGFNCICLCLVDYLFLFTFGIIITFLLLNVLWSDLLKSEEQSLVEKGNTVYTIETLIGMNGIITNNIQDKQYLGKLNDNENSDILITIEDNTNIKSGDKFTVDRIENDTIFAKKI